MKKIRIIGAALLICCLLTAFTAVPASAETESGKCGDNLTYSFNTDTGELTISGTGPMWDDYDEPIGWGGGRGPSPFAKMENVLSLKVEEGVTAIGGNAFHSCENLKNVFLPSTLTYIGGGAFKQNQSLETISIPDSVSFIGAYCFYGCTSLKSVVLPEGIHNIYDMTFEECTSLKVVLAEGVAYVERRAFKNCFSLEEVILGVSLTSVDKTAFEGCTKLKNTDQYGTLLDPIEDDWTSFGLNGEVTLIKYLGTDEDVSIPSMIGGFSVLGIDSGALSGNDRIKSVTIPRGIHRIGENAFDGCTSLTDIFYGGTEIDWNKLKVADIPGVTVHFTKASAGPFSDVPEGEWYADPLKWAVEKGITKGTSETTFSPEEGCTRGQVVTFLWRAAGEPEPNYTVDPFTDVKYGYYHKAVLWAVEKGITTGTSSNTFSPDDFCTRGQIVTFLYRANGSPEPAKRNNPFRDVEEREYYFDAVLWAVENKITVGTSAKTFSPEETCIRAQIVTFLYRYESIAQKES